MYKIKLSFLLLFVSLLFPVLGWGGTSDDEGSNVGWSSKGNFELPQPNNLIYVPTGRSRDYTPAPDPVVSTPSRGGGGSSSQPIVPPPPNPLSGWLTALPPTHTVTHVQEQRVLRTAELHNSVEQSRQQNLQRQNDRVAECTDRMKLDLESDEHFLERTQDLKDKISQKLNDFDSDAAFELRRSVAKWERMEAAEAVDAMAAVGCSIEQMGDAVESYQDVSKRTGDEIYSGTALNLAKSTFELGLNQLTEASKALSKDIPSSMESLEVSDSAREIGLAFLDLATSLMPGVSVGRDAYEAFTGKSLIDGRDLETWERTLSVLSLASLGTGNLLRGSIKAIEKVSHIVHAGEGARSVEHAIHAAVGIAESATHFKPSVEASMLFATPQKAVGHFAKHEGSLRTALGKDIYSFGEFMADANHVVKEGTFAKEINGYVKIIGGGKDAKAAVVGLTRDGTAITTFHIEKIKNLAKDAPSLGWVK